VNDQFLNLGSFKVGNGSQIRFWEEKWLGNQPLKLKYPSLFNIVRRKQDTIANILPTMPLNISFRRGLVGAKLEELEHICVFFNRLESSR
jgi:hypothetical protein